MTKNSKLLIALAVAAAAIAGYWMLVLSPKREQLAKLDADLAAAQVELSQAQATLTTYEKARGEYRANYATVVRLGKAVPADDDVRSLVVQLDTAAERSGVDFGSISVGGGSTDTSVAVAGATPPPPGAVSVGPAGFNAMPFTFAFGGDFDGLSNFFSRLERFVTVSNERIDVTGRLLRIESLSLKTDDGDGSAGLTAEIGASSYLLPSGQEAGGGGSPAGPAAAGVTPASTPAPGTPTPPTTTATSTGAVR